MTAKELCAWLREYGDDHYDEPNEFVQAANEIERLERQCTQAIALLSAVHERLTTLNDPTKARSHAAVTAELMLSTLRIVEFLKGDLKVVDT